MLILSPLPLLLVLMVYRFSVLSELVIQTPLPALLTTAGLVGLLMLTIPVPPIPMSDPKLPVLLSLLL